jgi:hypothetical protein
MDPICPKLTYTTTPRYIKLPSTTSPFWTLISLPHTLSLTQYPSICPSVSVGRGEGENSLPICREKEHHAIILDPLYSLLLHAYTLFTYSYLNMPHF